MWYVIKSFTIISIFSEQFELDTAAAMANDVTATILAQRMELDSKSKTIEMLQKALKQQRELTVYHTKEMEKEGEKRISLQKSEYEATIKRHQCFIDQVGIKMITCYISSEKYMYVVEVYQSYETYASNESL